MNHRGIVIEIQDNGTVIVLTPDGDFHEVKTNGQVFELGEEILYYEQEKPQEKKLWIHSRTFRYVAGLAAASVVFLLIKPFAASYNAQTPVKKTVCAATNRISKPVHIAHKPKENHFISAKKPVKEPVHPFTEPARDSVTDQAQDPVTDPVKDSTTNPAKEAPAKKTTTPTREEVKTVDKPTRRNKIQKRKYQLKNGYNNVLITSVPQQQNKPRLIRVSVHIAPVRLGAPRVPDVQL